MLFLYTAPLFHTAPTAGSDTVRQLLTQIGDNLQISPLTVQKTKEGRPFLKGHGDIDISFGFEDGDKAYDVTFQVIETKPLDA